MDKMGILNDGRFPKSNFNFMTGKITVVYEIDKMRCFPC